MGSRTENAEYGQDRREEGNRGGNDNEAIYALHIVEIKCSYMDVMYCSACNFFFGVFCARQCPTVHVNTTFGRSDRGRVHDGLINGRAAVDKVAERPILHIIPLEKYYI